MTKPPSRTGVIHRAPSAGVQFDALGVINHAPTIYSQAPDIATRMIQAPDIATRMIQAPDIASERPDSSQAVRVPLGRDSSRPRKPYAPNPTLAPILSYGRDSSRPQCWRTLRPSRTQATMTSTHHATSQRADPPTFSNDVTRTTATLAHLPHCTSQQRRYLEGVPFALQETMP
jgi:hypothetical protein